jgi:hypothetical protein
MSDLQLFGSESLLQEIPTAAFYPDEAKTTAMTNRMDGGGNAHQRRFVPKSKSGIVLVYPQRRMMILDLG